MSQNNRLAPLPPRNEGGVSSREHTPVAPPDDDVEVEVDKYGIPTHLAESEFYEVNTDNRLYDVHSAFARDIEDFGDDDHFSFLYGRDKFSTSGALGPEVSAPKVSTLFDEVPFLPMTDGDCDPMVMPGAGTAFMDVLGFMNPCAMVPNLRPTFPSAPTKQKKDIHVNRFSLNNTQI